MHTHPGTRPSSSLYPMRRKSWHDKRAAWLQSTPAAIQTSLAHALPPWPTYSTGVLSSSTATPLASCMGQIALEK